MNRHLSGKGRKLISMFRWLIIVFLSLYITVFSWNKGKNATKCVKIPVVRSSTILIGFYFSVTRLANILLTVRTPFVRYWESPLEFGRHISYTFIIRTNTRDKTLLFHQLFKKKLRQQKQILYSIIITFNSLCRT